MQVTVVDGKDKTHALSDVQYVGYQTDYLRIYWDIVEDALPNASTQQHKMLILAEAKRVAKQQATDRVLARIGAEQTSFSTKYKGVDTADVALFRATLKDVDRKNDDNGSYSQEETKQAILMLPNLTDEQRAYLWQSQNSSWKNNPWR